MKIFAQSLFVVIGISLIVACGNEGSNATDTLNKPARAITGEDVLIELKESEGKGDKQAEYFSMVLDELFKAEMDAKVVYIVSNVLYNLDTEEDIKRFVPIFLKKSEGRAEIENFHTALKSAYVTRFPQDRFSASVKEVQTISTLLENKADLINNNNFNRFSIPDAKDYIEMSESYGLINPRDIDAGNQIMKAGNTAKSISGYGAKAVVLYNWILEKQPDHPKAGQALFLKAFTYDNELKQPEQAKKFYTEFLEKYPDDDFADDAQLLLQHVGKSDEEFYNAIIKEEETK